jgi:hypothetical protein
MGFGNLGDEFEQGVDNAFSNLGDVFNSGADYATGTYSSQLPPPDYSSYQQPQQSYDYSYFAPSYDDTGTPNSYYNAPAPQQNFNFYDYLPPSYDDTGMPSYSSPPSYFAPAYDDTGMPTDSSYKPQFDSGNVWNKLSNIANGFFNPAQQQPYQNDYPTTDFLTGQQTDQQFNPGGSQYLTDQQANQYLDQGVNNNWLSGLAKGALEVAGTPFVLAGKGLEGVADANIPGVSDFARDLGPAIGNTWGTALQAAQSTYGAVRSGQFPNPANPTSYETQFMLGLRPQAAGNDVLANIKSREQPGLQAFGQLSPEEQLAFTLFDPTNKFVDATVHPFAEGLKNAYETQPIVRGTAPFSGEQFYYQTPSIKDAVDNLTDKIRSPQDRLNEFRQYGLDSFFEQMDVQTATQGLSELDVLKKFTADPEYRSSLGYENINESGVDMGAVGDNMAQAFQDVIDRGEASKLIKEGDKLTKNNKNPNVNADLPANQVELAKQMYKQPEKPAAPELTPTQQRDVYRKALKDDLYNEKYPQELEIARAEGQAKPEDVAKARAGASATNESMLFKGKTPEEYARLEQERPNVAETAKQKIEAKQTSAATTSTPEPNAAWDAIGSANKPAPTTTPKTLDQLHPAIQKLRVGKDYEQLGAADYKKLSEQAYGLRNKSYLVDKKGVLREAKPFEGGKIPAPVQMVLRGPRSFTGFLARNWLNSPGRLIKDPTSGLFKTIHSGYGDALLPWTSKMEKAEDYGLSFSHLKEKGGSSHDILFWEAKKWSNQTKTQKTATVLDNAVGLYVNTPGRLADWVVGGVAAASKKIRGKELPFKNMNELVEYPEKMFKEGIGAQAGAKYLTTDTARVAKNFAAKHGIPGDEVLKALRNTGLDLGQKPTPKMMEQAYDTYKTRQDTQAFYKKEYGPQVADTAKRLENTPFEPIADMVRQFNEQGIKPGSPEFEQFFKTAPESIDSTWHTLSDLEQQQLKAAGLDSHAANAAQYPSFMKQQLANWQDSRETFFATKYQGKDIVSQRSKRSAEKPQLIGRKSAENTQEAPKAPATKVIPEFPVKDLAVDPDRFQYKMLPADSGATGSLSGVQKFDRDLSGTILAWKDPADGKTYVVNGHNRVDLAKKLGQDTLTVRMLDAKDAPEARSTGALANIAEGRGDAIDAAKFFRDTKLTADEIRAKGIPLREKIAQDGLALSNLNDVSLMP